jgi:hypothetical protein
MAATERQRVAVAGRPCIVCGTDRLIDAAHLIPRSLGGHGDPLCVVPVCRVHHRAYDRGDLDLLAYLEPAWRAQLAHAVGHVGLIGALWRISGRHVCRVGLGIRGLAEAWRRPDDSLRLACVWLAWSRAIPLRA